MHCSNVVSSASIYPKCRAVVKKIVIWDRFLPVQSVKSEVIRNVK
jgi:hypothetical protein